MNQAFLVDPFQRLHNRLQQEDQIIHIHRPLPVHNRFKILPVQELHDKISRIILFKIIFYINDTFLRLQTTENHRLLKKALFPFLKGFMVFFLCHINLAAIGIHSGSQMLGKIFLDCDLHLQPLIKTLVGDSKTTLTDHIHDDIAIIQSASGLQAV